MKDMTSYSSGLFHYVAFNALFFSPFNSQIQETQDTANKVRQSTDNLDNQMRRARDDLDADLQETRDFVKELKDFLSGETLTVMFQYLQ
jgi:hypothetical protein